MTTDTIDNALQAAPAAPAKQPGHKPLPEDALAILPLRNMVLLPGLVAPVTFGREMSVAAAQEALKTERRIGLLLQRDDKQDKPTPADLYWVGTSGPILRYVTGSEGAHHAVVQGEERFRVLEFLEGWPFLVARVATVPASDDQGPEIEARFHQLKARAAEVVGLLPQAPGELANMIAGIQSASMLTDVVANFLDVKPEDKQKLLESFDLRERLDRVLALVSQRLEVLRISAKIGEETRKVFDERQREHVLREQMRQIQKELGESDDSAAEVEELGRAIDAAGMPPEVDKHARKELKRLERMSAGGGEGSTIRTYLEVLTELPWKSEAQQPIDIAAARQVLDDDHYGLAKIKRRILEWLAVRKLNPEGKSPILCFVGPPGVGKTSLGQSIAKATGRGFQRIALGGVHDEAEIRGHRRTYVGSMPGNIIQALKRVQSRTSVFMLDEIDKLGAGGFHGDPSSALLEVLDPEQNAKFRDNYLGVDFDLSKVLFIATANVLDSIPGPLRDRMEIIQLPGYTEAEKLEIAKRYLVKRQLEANGLTPEQVGITDAALAAIIGDYTREAGVRNLEREIGSVFRRSAMNIAEGGTTADAGADIVADADTAAADVAGAPVLIDAPDLHAVLGQARFDNEIAQRAGLAGVATGLAWTPVGGDILFIEATKVPGSGKLILTGQLGEVMKESAQAALTLAKMLVGEALDKSDLHVHIPAGATPKDGPSAGVAMYLALVSLLTGKPVRSDIAMTGEISLRGLVLPIGGVKEKVLAALRAGITTVMLPRRNQRDLDDVPADARARLQFVLLDRVEDAVRVAIDGELLPPELLKAA